VAALLTIYCVLTMLTSRRVVNLPEREDDWSSMGAIVVWAVLCLSLLTVLSSVPRRVVNRQTTWWSRSVDLLGCVLAAGLCVWSAISNLLVPCLVHFGLMSIEMAQPLRCAIEGLPLSVSARANRFLIYAAMGAAVSLLNLILARQLPRCWNRGPRARWMVAGLLGLGLAASAAHLLWLGKVGAWSLSPWWADVLEIGPVYRWILALVLFAFPATSAAYRDSRLPAKSPAPNAPCWRRRPRSYYHERTAVIGLLLLTSGAPVVAGFCVEILHSDLEDCLWYIASCFTNVPLVFFPAIFFATIGAARASWRPPPEIHSTAPPALPPGRFLAAWAAYLLAFILGFPALIALVFGMMIAL